MAREDRSRRETKYPPPGVDAKAPNVARVYDAFLGGKDNFAADRQVVEFALRVTPNAPAAARANRAFLRRTVQYLVAEAGITQILDIGSGLPAPGNVHEVARGINPSVRTVYVDNDPVVYTHGQALLADARTTEVIAGDVRRPTEIVDHPIVRQFIDFRQPVGLLLLAVLHHISDDEDPSGVVAALRGAMPGRQSSRHLQFPDARNGPGRAARQGHRDGEAVPRPSRVRALAAGGDHPRLVR